MTAASPRRRARPQPASRLAPRVVRTSRGGRATDMPSMLTSTRMFRAPLDCHRPSFRYDLATIVPNPSSVRRRRAGAATPSTTESHTRAAFPILKRKGIRRRCRRDGPAGVPFWQVHDRLDTCGEASHVGDPRPAVGPDGAWRSAGCTPRRSPAKDRTRADGFGAAPGHADDVGRTYDGLKRASARSTTFADARLARLPQFAAPAYAHLFAYEEHVSLPASATVADDSSGSFERSRRSSATDQHFAYPLAVHTPTVEAVANAATSSPTRSSTPIRATSVPIGAPPARGGFVG